MLPDGPQFVANGIEIDMIYVDHRRSHAGVPPSARGIEQISRCDLISNEIGELGARTDNHVHTSDLCDGTHDDWGPW
jgi:hypothetical protein